MCRAQRFWWHERQSLKTRDTSSVLETSSHLSFSRHPLYPGFRTPKPSGHKHHFPHNVCYPNAIVSLHNNVCVQQVFRLWGCSSVMEHLPSMHKVPDSIPNNSTEHTRQFQMARILSFQIKQGLGSSIYI